MKKSEKINPESCVRDHKPTKPTKKPATVLHVDDDPNDTTLLQVACAKADVDFELRNIGDCSEVIDYLSGTGKYADRARYQFPDLVLLDMKMPKANGLDILKRIRSDSMLKHLPVIVLSGSEMQEDMHRAFEGGANSYLVKPSSFGSLVNMVKDIGAQLPQLPKGGASRSCA